MILEADGPLFAGETPFIFQRQTPEFQREAPAALPTLVAVLSAFAKQTGRWPTRLVVTDRELSHILMGDDVRNAFKYAGADPRGSTTPADAIGQLLGITVILERRRRRELLKEAP